MISRPVFMIYSISGDALTMNKKHCPKFHKYLVVYLFKEEHFILKHLSIQSYQGNLLMKDLTPYLNLIKSEGN
jgi:hypothetical protein